MFIKTIPEVKHTTSTLALFEKMYVGRPFVPFANWCVRAQISQQNKSSDLYRRPPTKHFLYKSQRFLTAVSMDFSWIETEIDTYDAYFAAIRQTICVIVVVFLQMTIEMINRHISGAHCVRIPSVSS